MATSGELRLTGLDGVYDMLRSLPEEVVSKKGGPVRAALVKGARVIVNEEKKNLRAVTSNATKRGEQYSTGLLAKSVRMLRKRPPPGVNGERYIVGLRRVIYLSGNKVRGRKLATTDTGFYLEFGTSKQAAEPWARPAFQAKAAEAILTTERELVVGVDRIVIKLLKNK